MSNEQHAHAQHTDHVHEAHHEISFMETYWQVFIIAFGIGFALFCSRFSPHT